MRNPEIARRFERLADLLAIKGDNQFKIRAFRRAANIIESLPREAAELIADGEELRQYDGIGEAIAEKIKDFVETGTTKALKEAEEAVPPSTLELLRLPDLGPKRAGELFRTLGVDSLSALGDALEAGKLDGLPGFGPKLIGNLREGLKQAEAQGTEERRVLLSEAEAAAEQIIAYLRQVEGLEQIEAAGSLRRRRETVGDLDILAVGRDPASLTEHFLGYPESEKTLMEGDTRCSIRLNSGLQIDLRVLPAESIGAALQYFTGSKDHNVVLRRRAQERGLKVNEYGVYDGDRQVAGRSEAEVYESIGLPWIPPELREDGGEFAAAESGLPALVTLDDIKGDLHSHTTASDGKSTLEEMAREAIRLGRSYLAISDHSPRLTVARGLSPERLRRQWEEIDRLNKELTRITLLKSMEVDILEDGSLDLPDELLKELDLVIVAVHSKFNLSEAEQTARVCRALEHPQTNILAHPTGRRLGSRSGYAIKLEEVFRAAVANGCFLEINAQPERLDLAPQPVRRAKELGARFVVSTDAHAARHLEYMRYGVDQARRGWLAPDDVINTRPIEEMRKLLGEAQR